MNRDHFLFIYEPGESQFQVVLIFTERIKNGSEDKQHNLTCLRDTERRGGSFRAEEFSTQEGMLKGYQGCCA